MRKLKRKNYNGHIKTHSSDVKRIVEIFEKRGFEISEEDACWAWERHSDEWAAGWLGLGNDDDEIFNDVIEYLTEDEQ